MTLPAAAETAAVPFEPRIIGFLCNWCSYAGADRAGSAWLVHPPNVRVVRVMCTGRIDAQFVLKAFEHGADGVLILGCHPGDCHYQEQNYRMIARHRALLRLLEPLGVDARRCHLDFVSATEAEQYAEIIRNVVDTIRALGPLSSGRSGGVGPHQPTQSSGCGGGRGGSPG